MKRLILTGYDPLPEGGEAEYLGPWAHSTADFLNLGWKESCHDRSTVLREFSPATEFVSEYLVGYISERLNERFGRNRSRKYWRILLMSWLINLVQVVFERYSRIRKCVASGRPYEVYLPPPGARYAIKNTLHFATAALENPLNQLIFSRIIEALNPAGWVFRESEPVEVDAYLKSHRKRALKLGLLLWFSVLASNLGSIFFYNIPGMGRREQIWLSLRIGARRFFHRKPENVTSGVNQEPDKNYTKTEVLNKLEAAGGLSRGEGEQFIEIAERLSMELLPDAYDVDYRKNEQRARLMTKVSPRVDVIVCGPAVSRDESAKFYVADLVESRNARIVINQHGGNYGLLETFSFTHQVEYRTCDTFLSWGWERHSGYEMKSFAVSSPLLSRMRRRAPERDAPAIFVGTATWKYLRQMDSILFPEDTGKYLEDKIDFFQVLPKDILESFLYRPYIDRRARDIEMPFIKERAPDVQILEGKLEPALAGCRICVVDHPGTTAFKTLAARVPTLLFWDEDVWRMQGNAKEAVDMLEKVGVFHPNPERAARHLKSVWADIDGWWSDSETRNAVEQFSFEYCRASDDWQTEWLDLFPFGEFRDDNRHEETLST